MFQQFKTQLTLSLALSSFVAAHAEDVSTPAITAQASRLMTPPAYFLFASDIGNGTKAISVQKVERAISQYGKNILVGVDSGCVEDGEAAAIIETTRKVGARLHIYLEGPGGVTGEQWTADELARIKVRATAEGIDTGVPLRDWMAIWNREGWKTFTYKQLRAYKALGFESAEIDNLANGIAKDPENVKPAEYLEFFKLYRQWFEKGDVPRLMLKNLSEDELDALIDAVNEGHLPREMFADFHIAETDSGDKRKQAAQSARIGIKTVFSGDTEHYSAFGVYDIQPPK